MTILKVTHSTIKSVSRSMQGGETKLLYDAIKKVRKDDALRSEILSSTERECALRQPKAYLPEDIDHSAAIDLAIDKIAEQI